MGRFQLLAQFTLWAAAIVVLLAGCARAQVLPASELNVGEGKNPATGCTSSPNYCAESQSRPRVEIPQAPTPRIPEWKKRTRVFDRETSFELAAVAASLSADAVSTERVLGLSCPAGVPVCIRESNPLVRAIARNRAGTAAYFGGAFAVDVTATYLLRRHNHSRIARVLNLSLAGAEFARVGVNYADVHWFVHHDAVQMEPR